LQMCECHHPCPIRATRAEGDRRVILFTFPGWLFTQPGCWAAHVPIHYNIPGCIQCDVRHRPHRTTFSSHPNMLVPTCERQAMKSCQHACQQTPALSRSTPLHLHDGTSSGASLTEPTFEPHMTLDFRSLLHPEELPNGSSAHRRAWCSQSERWGRVIVGVQG
jgi:hypothetical protein